MISRLTDSDKVVGVKQVKRALNSETVKAVYIAKDAEEKVIGEISEICTEKQIQVFYVENMRELGEACKIDVNAAVAALII